MGVTTDVGSTTATRREGGVRTIEDLQGPAGRLEALLNPGPQPEAAPFSVLLCHPHPLFAGTFHNKVVYHAMKTFNDLGLPVLRFNFRGAGRSEGVHDNGIGEQQDAAAGIDWLAAEYGLPVVATGFSFGAHMALRAGCADPRVPAMVSLGTPIEAGNRKYSYEFLDGCEKPILFLSGSEDEFAPVPLVEAAIHAATGDRTVAWIEGADHFFKGMLASMQDALRSWMSARVLPLAIEHPGSAAQ